MGTCNVFNKLTEVVCRGRVLVTSAPGGSRPLPIASVVGNHRSLGARVQFEANIAILVAFCRGRRADIVRVAILGEDLERICDIQAIQVCQ